MFEKYGCTSVCLLILLWLFALLLLLWYSSLIDMITCVHIVVHWLFLPQHCKPQKDPNLKTRTFPGTQWFFSPWLHRLHVHPSTSSLEYLWYYIVGSQWGINEWMNADCSRHLLNNHSTLSTQFSLSKHWFLCNQFPVGHILLTISHFQSQRVASNCTKNKPSDPFLLVSGWFKNGHVLQF